MMKLSVERIGNGLVVATGAVVAGAVVYEGARLATETLRERHAETKGQTLLAHDILDESQDSGDGGFIMTEGKEIIVSPLTPPYILL